MGSEFNIVAVLSVLTGVSFYETFLRLYDSKQVPLDSLESFAACDDYDLKDFLGRGCCIDTDETEEGERQRCCNIIIYQHPQLNSFLSCANKKEFSDALTEWIRAKGFKTHINIMTTKEIELYENEW